VGSSSSSIRLSGVRRFAAGAEWYLLAALLLGIAFIIFVRATHRGPPPPLALSVHQSGFGPFDLLLSGGVAGGSYDLLVDDSNHQPAREGPFTVPAGESVHHSVQVAAGQQVRVWLVAAGSSQPLRSVVLRGPGQQRSGAAPTPESTQPPVLGSASPLPTIPLQLPSRR
jgi:hypothetical protein